MQENYYFSLAPPVMIIDIRWWNQISMYYHSCQISHQGNPANNQFDVI